MGGVGKDVFRLDGLADSGPDEDSRDTIADFATTVDLIDLSGIDARVRKDGDQYFSFIGADGFHDKSGELRYVGGILKGDVDGDGSADFAIKLAGAPVLVENDLIL